jgi:hypothetical protein
LVALGLALAWPATAAAADETDTARPRHPRLYQALEVQGVITGELMPRPFLGLDGAYAIGTESFQLRIGATVTGSPAYRMGIGDVANVLYAGLADICAGKAVEVHRIRMCVGGEAGVWQHLWRGDLRRQYKSFSPHVGGTLKADYTYFVTPRFGVMGGVGVMIPVVGPSFRGRDQFDRPTALLIPGPVAGSARLGVSFRI